MRKISVKKLKTQTSYFSLDNVNENYQLIMNLFSTDLEKHAPLKEKFLREIYGNIHD